MAIGALATNGAMAVLFEGGKISRAAKQGKTVKQLLGSTINFGKWLAIPAALAMLNPVSVVAATAVGVAGFVLPNFIPEIDFTNKEEGQNLSVLG